MPDPQLPPTVLSSGDTAPCIGCGLCCDGTVFARAKVRPGDEDGLLRYGMTMVTENGSPLFALPCRHHEQGNCTIYEDRFSTCRRFKCALLTSYQEGELTLDDARIKVEEAHRMRSEIAAEEPAAAIWAERLRLTTQLGSSKDNAGLLVKLIAFDRFIDRWFRKRPKPAPEAAL